MIQKGSSLGTSLGEIYAKVSNSSLEISSSSKAI
jgi:hypothetical protein